MAPIVARRATGQLLAFGPRLAAAAARRRRMVQGRGGGRGEAAEAGASRGWRLAAGGWRSTQLAATERTDCTVGITFLAHHPLNSPAGLSLSGGRVRVVGRPRSRWAFACSALLLCPFRRRRRCCHLSRPRRLISRRSASEPTFLGCKQTHTTFHRHGGITNPVVPTLGPISA